MTTYKPTNNTVATYGESSAAVKALQTQLNTANAGQAGYTPLKVDGKYGPLTLAATKYQAPSATPAPAPTPEPTFDASRVARTVSPHDAGIEKVERQIRDMTLQEPDLGKITEEKRKGAQAVIDSITAQFNKTLEDQGVINSGMNDRVRALNVGAGLGGSDFATSAAVGQETKNKKANDLIVKERDAKINEILAGVDSRASEEYRAQRLEYVKSLGDDLTRRKEAKNEDRNRAKETIAGLASQGVTIEKLKSVDPQTYETLLGEYGGSQIDMETAWNASLPENLKVQYGQITKRGANGNAVILRYGLNPVTGKTESKEYDMGIKYGDFVGGKEPELKEIDGRLWTITTDENGNQVAKPLTEVSELTRSQINQNNASAAKSRADAKNVTDNPTSGFKFSGTQRSKLINTNFNDSDINAMEKDLKQYGIEAVLKRLSSSDQAALRDAMAGSDLATQIAELMKSQQ